MAEDQEVSTDPTPRTVKKLFAYSGNQCAIDECSNPLVDVSGTVLGKIAHIHAARAGGSRFVKEMTNQQRRAFENLMVVCGGCHDIIDDKDNLADWPAEKLKRYKKAHEDRFRRLERRLIDDFADATQATQPSYPSNLDGLAEALETPELSENDEELKGILEFITKLKELPLAEREFALKLADRMRRREVTTLLVDDVMGAFNIGSSKLQKHIRVLEEHRLGDISETMTPHKYEVVLYDREPGGNPWIEILDFCDSVGVSTDDLILDLNFDSYQS